LSREGLEKRGYNEEVFLNPLYKRVENHTNPALTMLNNLENDVSIEDVIRDYGTFK